jgi:Icc-related predicted phosphoesterase
MKKQILFVALLMAFFAGATAKEVTGKVHCNKKGMKDVVVTDGTNFTTTDQNGIYKLDAVDNADFIHIVTPSGYVASYASGTPRFYHTLSEKSLDFELFEFSAPQGAYTLFAIGDTQPGSDQAYARLETEAFPELKSYGNEYINKGMPVAAIMLGDMIWDNPETYGRYKEDLKQLGYPVYPVIGNHDHTEIYNDNHQSEQVYRLYFGPTYYAFNMGCDYYIVLDNIFYTGLRQYDEMLTAGQLEWVKQYTRYIPKGAHVFVAMHAPAKMYTSDHYLKGAEELMDLLRDYQVSILSGHSHIHSNLLLRPNVREHMVASIGGAWWLWNRYCMDGTPMGYQVFESTPRGLTWHFKTLGMPADYQMKVFPIGTFADRLAEVCVKVQRDETWKVEWKEDGKLKGSMTQFSAIDPDYKGYINREYAQGAKKLTWRFPVENPFIFFSAKPSPKAQEMEIIVTDHFGRQYIQKVRL